LLHPTRDIVVSVVQADIQYLFSLAQLAAMQNDTVANQVSALSVVHNSFQDQELRGMKRKLADMTLEMERARMATEDARGAMVSKYGTNHHTKDPRFRRLSWREFAVERNNMCDHLVYEVLEPAKELIEEARTQIRVVMDNHQVGDGRQAALAGALTTSYKALVAVEKVLRDDESDGRNPESDSESAPESVSENATGAGLDSDGRNTESESENSEPDSARRRHLNAIQPLCICWPLCQQRS